ncbi:hypothetical protein AHF37_02177 [Paragonimus kellicotti]|nr:hypothetical protein AHF37_02177 [Paragonimus kellicotti]
MITNSVRQTVTKVVTEVKIPTPFALSYGTAGFRCAAQQLKGVAVRVGILAALRSLLKDGQFVGVMITASHNPADDNGMKIVDPDGGMLDPAWEPVVVDFMHCSTSLVAEWLQEKVTNLEAHVHPRVVLGYDTRASSPSLAEEVLVGIEAMSGLCVRLGLVTTPQLHFAVKHLNDSSYVTSLGDAPEPNLDQIYIHHFASRFAHGLRFLLSKKGEQAECDLINLNVDCAHGVGSLALAKLNDQLISSACPLRLHLFNTDVDKRDLLNNDCGADFVKLFSKAPKIHSALSAIPCSPSDRWATVDGDADRLLYFYHAPASTDFGDDVQTDAVAAGDSSRIILLDGDRIACLFASFLTSVLLASDGGRSLTVGVIQTAYANAGSTIYLRDHLHVTVSCVPTGVKHLHHAAQAFDFGIYFEANGHGTILYSATALNYVRSLDSDHPLSVFVDLTNTTVGDALTDILLVEYALAWHGWSLADWSKLYRELASRQIKVALKSPTSIKTTDAERRVCSPASLQSAIDDLIEQVEQATMSPGTVRAFVRPSGTENIARVYCEAIHSVWADWLAQKVAIATHQLAGGTGQPPPDPGPVPS